MRRFYPPHPPGTLHRKDFPEVTHSPRSPNPMNSNQPANQVQPNQVGPIQKLKSLVRNNLVGTINITVAGSLILTSASTWNIWNIYNGFQSIVTNEFELQKVSDELTYNDEVLTMSARMLVSTGDLQWAARYKEFTPKAEASVKKFVAIVPSELRAEAAKTDAASTMLFNLEAKAFKLIEQDQQKAAYQILAGPEYAAQKQIYNVGNNAILAKVDRSIKAELEDYRQQLIASIVIAGGTLPILLASWLLVLAAVQDYIHDRKTAQAAIELSQIDLRHVNQQLAGEVEVRAIQQQQIQLESELLQIDIGHILDVVCSIEEGDLTVEADVNERATGLISDTLNRLIESLDRIVSAVVDTAFQVTTDAEQLESVAIETAQQAQVQAIEVRSVKELMDNINSLTSDSRQQAIATAVAVQQAKSAVLSGKQAIESTTKGIETLQQSTNQIVKRSELLTEFVDLAAQFSKDQKRVAALTRVLALNVSTISSRAIRERDPDQFASLAKEFESIALQVNTLATDTHQSLASLQQKTERVQTVTSGLTQDISDINQLVQKFTSEVNKTNQAFDNIQTVTDQVADMSKQVNTSSQDIVQMVNIALTAIGSISTVAQATESKASITREQVQSMGDLADKLLKMVEFFKLSNTTSGQNSTPVNQLQQPRSKVSPAQSEIDQIPLKSLPSQLISV
jgi:methyl-accepting chemotaxis protein PixJ